MRRRSCFTTSGWPQGDLGHLAWLGSGLLFAKWPAAARSWPLPRSPQAGLGAAFGEVAGPRPALATSLATDITVVRLRGGWPQTDFCSFDALALERREASELLYNEWPAPGLPWQLGLVRFRAAFGEVAGRSAILATPQESPGGPPSCFWRSGRAPGQPWPLPSHWAVQQFVCEVAGSRLIFAPSLR